MNRDILRQVANVITLVVTLIINFLSQLPPPNGIGVATSAEIANRYPDLYYFPANSAFSIWGIIYTALIAFVVYQALPAQRTNPHLQRLGWLFVVTGIFNTAWLFSFQYEQFALSMIMMFILLGTLITIYLRLGIGRIAVSPRDKLLIHVPFSLYLGWITAATVTNASYLLRNTNWDGFGIAPEIWAVVMLAITGVLGLAMIVRHRDIAYALVIAWATYWIATRHSGVQPVAFAALTVAGLMIVSIIATVVINNRPTAPINASRATA
ncbi:MAG: tryptophan-rich sensory protein [Anaerolineae bacterium]|nr:tryptophan-rich sensory protein [Anaerolineae bacterium]